MAVPVPTKRAPASLVALAYPVLLNATAVAWLLTDRLEDDLWPFAFIAVLGGLAAVGRPAFIAKVVGVSFVGWGLLTLLTLRGEELGYGLLFFFLIAVMQIGGLIVGLWGFGMRATASRRGQNER